MWYLLTIIIGIIGSFIAMTGEPMGAILFIPMVATGMWEEFKGITK
jgi:mannose/fructose/N-acetylgalactosamine-specific phosphotransferase system component IID